MRGNRPSKFRARAFLAPSSDPVNYNPTVAYERLRIFLFETGATPAHFDAARRDARLPTNPADTPILGSMGKFSSVRSPDPSSLLGFDRLNRSVSSYMAAGYPENMDSPSSGWHKSHFSTQFFSLFRYTGALNRCLRLRWCSHSFLRVWYR